LRKRMGRGRGGGKDAKGKECQEGERGWQGCQVEQWMKKCGMWGRGAAVRGRVGD
jgi:hypothetical protein